MLVCFLFFGENADGKLDDPGGDSAESEKVEKLEEEDDDEELKAAFQAWKSKTYALTVPLTIVALRGSLPPSWIKVRLSYIFSYYWSRQ